MARNSEQQTFAPLFTKSGMKGNFFKEKQMKKIKDKKMRYLLTFLLAGIYFVSYMTRINYKAVLSAVIESEGMLKADASLALTGLFIVYGLGQLVSGWLGDRVKPKYLITFGLVLATAMNLLLPLKTDKIYMLVIWSINGFGQAMMWPPIVRIMSDWLSTDDYVFTAVKVSWGSCFATILIYFLAPVLVKFTGWRTIFVICATFGAVGAVIAYLSLTFFEKYTDQKGIEDMDMVASDDITEKPKLAWKDVFLIIAVCAVIVLQGALRDGVDSWMPNYITENFGVETWIAIMTGVLIPIATLFFYRLATLVTEKLVRDEMKGTAVFFTSSALFCGVLFCIRTVAGAIIPSIVCFVMIIGSMHATNMILTGIIPRSYTKYGNVSFVSGALNCGTYVGSAIFTWVIADLSEKAGWNVTILSWIAISVAGILGCLALIPLWRRFKAK